MPCGPLLLQLLHSLSLASSSALRRSTAAATALLQSRIVCCLAALCCCSCCVASVSRRLLPCSPLLLQLLRRISLASPAALQPSAVAVTAWPWPRIVCCLAALCRCSYCVASVSHRLLPCSPLLLRLLHRLSLASSAALQPSAAVASWSMKLLPHESKKMPASC